MTVDPLSTLQISVQSFDVRRIASVYADTAGNRWWTKAWFNGNERGEKAIEISREMAIKFNNDLISKDDWLSRFYPKQMSNYYSAIQHTRQHFLGV